MSHGGSGGGHGGGHGGSGHHAGYGEAYGHHGSSGHNAHAHSPYADASWGHHGNAVASHNGHTGGHVGAAHHQAGAGQHGVAGLIHAINGAYAHVFGIFFHALGQAFGFGTHGHGHGMQGPPGMHHINDGPVMMGGIPKNGLNIAVSRIIMPFLPVILLVGGLALWLYVVYSTSHLQTAKTNEHVFPTIRYGQEMARFESPGPTNKPMQASECAQLAGVVKPIAQPVANRLRSQALIMGAPISSGGKFNQAFGRALDDASVQPGRTQSEPLGELSRPMSAGETPDKVGNGQIGQISGGLVRQSDGLASNYGRQNYPPQKLRFSQPLVNQDQGVAATDGYRVGHPQAKIVYTSR